MRYKRIYHKRIIIFLIMLMILTAIIFYSEVITDFNVKEILTYKPESFFFTALLFLIVYIIKGITMVIPLKFLFVLAGIIFPSKIAILVTYCGLFLETTVSFVLGYFLGSEYVLSLIDRNEKAKKILKLSLNNGVLSVFIVRLIPGIPADLISMFMGAVRIKYSEFILGTLLGITPSMIPVVLLGKAVTHPFSKEFLIPFFISVGVSICSAVVYKAKSKRNHHLKL